MKTELELAKLLSKVITIAESIRHIENKIIELIEVERKPSEEKCP